MTTDAERIQERIQGRGIAKTILALAELESQPPNVVEAFWDHFNTEGMLYQMWEDRAAELGSSAMTDAEADEFEHTKIDFGKYQGELFCNIPMEYIAWLADKSIKVRRYMQSRRAQRRQDQE